MQHDNYFYCPHINTKQMKQFFIITLLFLGWCCKDKPTPYVPVTIPCTLSRDIDTIKLNIKGTWEWLEEKRYYLGQQGPVYLTPKTEGYTSRMVIGNDTLRFFKNSKPDSVYTYKIIRWKEISGTNFHEDELPVLAFYRLYDNRRASFVPLKICIDYLLFQHQYVTSIGGEQIWKRQ